MAVPAVKQQKEDRRREIKSARPGAAERLEHAEGRQAKQRANRVRISEPTHDQ